jgi:hypothetical protein
MKSFMVLVASIATFSTEASAQELPPIFVYAEDIDDSETACGIRQASLVAAVESALRYNRVSIANNDDYINDRALSIYVNMMAAPINYESGRGTGSCYGSPMLSLETSFRVTNPVTGTMNWATVTFCRKRSLVIRRQADFAAEIDRGLSEMASECVSEYARTIRNQ